MKRSVSGTVSYAHSKLDWTGAYGTWSSSEFSGTSSNWNAFELIVGTYKSMWINYHNNYLAKVISQHLSTISFRGSAVPKIEWEKSDKWWHVHGKGNRKS